MRNVEKTKTRGFAIPRIVSISPEVESDTYAMLLCALRSTLNMSRTSERDSLYMGGI